MTSSAILPVITVIILATLRNTNEVVRRLISWTTVSLVGGWAVLSLVAAAIGHPHIPGMSFGLDYVALGLCYLGIASLVVKLPELALMIAKRTSEERQLTGPMRFARVAAVASMAALLYIVGTHGL